MTSSRTSTSSSTSDGLATRVAGLVRLVHPFPSVLDGLVVFAVALVAGGDPATASRLGVSMTFLQFAIGALNDIVDAPADAGRLLKPIPSGVISQSVARATAAIAAALGLVLAATVGMQVVAVAVLVLAIGAVYDLLAKGTPWSWLPFAVGIPLLPVYGWVGATGTLPAFFAILLPMAVLAGAALAVANARVDLEADRASGTRSVATALGAERSWWAGALLMLAATAIGLVAAATAAWAPLALAFVVVGTGVVTAGVALGRGVGPAARRRAWEAQAIGAAIAATGWIAGLLPRP